VFYLKCNHGLTYERRGVTVMRSK